MLFTIIIWLYILFLSYIFGWSILSLIHKVFYNDSKIILFSSPLAILIGLIGINTFAAFLSLFIKLGWLAQLIFLLLGLLLGMRLWKKNGIPKSFTLSSIPKLIFVLFLLVFLTVLENGTHGPANPDTGIYHAQAIRWIETFPAVPGLGNLHSRLAYDSNWLVINAFFSFSFLGLRSFHVLPGAFIIITLIYFLGGANQLLMGRITIANTAKTLFIPLVFFVLGSQISSPGTDFPATVGIWIVFSFWLDFIERKKAQQPSRIELEEILIFIFSVYFLTVKLTTAPLLLLSIFILIRCIIRKDIKSTVGLLVLAIFILAPWFARNLILSGYWIYPLPAISSLSPNWDWKIPINHVIDEQRSILAWARIPGGDADQVLAMPLRNWVKEWFVKLTHNQQFLVAGAIFSPIIFSIMSFFLLRKKSHFAYFSFAYLTSYCGLAFWLYAAPDIRFGYGFIFSTVLLTGIPLLTWLLSRDRLRKTAVFSLIAIMIFYQGFVLFASIDYKTLSARAILPTDYPTLGTNMCSIHGYTLACAKFYNECYYDPFPCIPPGSVNAKVEMRGNTLRSGFRVIKNPN